MWKKKKYIMQISLCKHFVQLYPQLYGKKINNKKYFALFIEHTFSETSIILKFK